MQIFLDKKKCLLYTIYKAAFFQANPLKTRRHIKDRILINRADQRANQIFGNNG